MSDTGLKSIAANNKEADTKSGLAAVIRNLNEVFGPVGYRKGV
ncbi:hypothetical protein PI126_g18842 [Phytophthora idaei]|nr:hypothetical protein PI126_g18842 [Phytophthora idaei]